MQYVPARRQWDLGRLEGSVRHTAVDQPGKKFKRVNELLSSDKRMPPPISLATASPPLKKSRRALLQTFLCEDLVESE